MGTFVDFDVSGRWVQSAGRRPGPVRDLHARMFGSQGLDLTWRPPAGGGPVLRYRIERTREGRVYEVMKEWRRCEFFFSPEPGEPWFYRVTAVNERGAGRARFVIFFCRVSRDGHAILQTIPVLPGVRITISELG